VSLRLKIILALTLIGMAATAAIGVVTYNNTRHQLLSAVERSLNDAAQSMRDRPALADPDRDGDGTMKPGGSLGSAVDRPRSFEQVLVQTLNSRGDIVLQPRSGALPVSAADRSIAQSGSANAAARHDTSVDGEPFRMLTMKFRDGAVQLARSVQENNTTLDRIFGSTLLAVVLVALSSMLVGWFIALTVTRRLERLALVAGEVASTGRLDVDVPVDGRDETGRLGRAFSGMLDALHRSKREQQQLVQDAGHELRTPLTSLRTNVSVLRRRFDNLAPDAREQLLNDLDSETRELTDLVNELVELATESRDDEVVQTVALAEIAEKVVGRARRRFVGAIDLVTDDSLVEGRPQAIERAMQNLVGNACKFAPDGPIEVAVSAGVFAVRDHGPGLLADDIPHLFDRFYRSVSMRSKPGSGLGLSIVKSMADVHGGTVFASNVHRPDGTVGGARIGFELPLAESE
jgi:two-component system sensor histidine kinase MprB